MKREDLQLYFIMGTSNVPPQQQPFYILEKPYKQALRCFNFVKKALMH